MNVSALEIFKKLYGISNAYDGREYVPLKVESTVAIIDFSEHSPFPQLVNTWLEPAFL